MDFLTFLSQVIQCVTSLCTSCVWPITVFVLLLILKDPLLGLLKRTQGLKIPGLLELELRELEKEAEEAELLAPRAPEIQTQAQELRRIAAVDTRGAVIKAWLLIEDSLRSLAANAGVQPRSPSTTRLITQLSRQDIISPALSSILSELKHIRNLAAHDLSFGEEWPAFQSYLSVSLRALETLGAIEDDLAESSAAKAE